MFFVDCESGSVASFGVRGTTRVFAWGRRVLTWACSGCFVWSGGCGKCVCVSWLICGEPGLIGLGFFAWVGLGLAADRCWMGPVRGFWRARACWGFEYEKGIWWMPWR